MFSGIVEEMGATKSLDRGLLGARATFLASTVLQDLQVGESISVSGTCLTVIEVGVQDFTVELSTETLRVTTLGSLKAGSPVNLERAMQLHARIGGHLVTGHVDGVGVIQHRHQDGNAIYFTIEAAEDILRYCIQKGSLTVDGISLTINDVSGKTLTVAVIPHTAQVTTIGLKQVGDRVNLETDLVGKYVERLLEMSGHVSSKPSPVIDRDYLQKHGLL